MKKLLLFVVALLVANTMFAQTDATTNSASLDVKTMNKMIRLRNAGSSLIKEKKYKEAVDSLQAAQKIRYSDTVNYFVAECALQSKQDELAIEAYNKCITNKYKDEPSYEKVAFLYNKKKDAKNFKATVDKGLAAYPNNASLKKQLIKSHLAKSQAELSAGQAIIKKAEPLKTKPTLYNAEMAKANERFKKALPPAKDAYAVDAKDKDALKMLITVYTVLKDDTNKKKYEDELKAVDTK